MRLVIVTLLSLFACGPSKEQRAGEARAYAAMLEHHIKIIRDLHACDDEVAAYKAAADALPEHVNRFNYASAAEQNEVADKAGARAKACRALMPSHEEMQHKLLVLSDAWMDACVECATGGNASRPSVSCAARSRITSSGIHKPRRASPWKR